MKNKIGTGNMAIHRNPRRLIAQGTPRLWNMGVANLQRH